MTGSSESIAALRNRAEHQSAEFETAIRELKHVAQHALEPARWIRERPLLSVSGALAIGLLLGARGTPKRRRRSR